MNKRSVNIVAIKDNWILHEIALRLGRSLKYTVHTEKPTGKSRITYSINYAQAASERVSEIEVALFTHLESGVPALEEKWADVGRRTDVAICMSNMYAKKVKGGKSKVIVIPPGVDLKKYKLKPIKIGVVGRVAKSNRKGEDLIKQVMDVPGIEWNFTGQGWPGKTQYLKAADMPHFYEGLDYVLFASRIEGGPMGAIEALACGVPVISPEVGWMPELPHITFRNGDAASLRKVLEKISLDHQRLRRSVENRTWDNFISKHDILFKKLLDIPTGKVSKRRIKNAINYTIKINEAA